MSALPIPRLPEGVGPFGLSVLLHVGVFALAMGVAHRTSSPWLEHDAGVAVGSTFEVATEDSTLSSTPSEDTRGDVPTPSSEAAEIPPAEAAPTPPETSPNPAEATSREASLPTAQDDSGEKAEPLEPVRAPSPAAPVVPASSSPTQPPRDSSTSPSAASPSGSDGSAGTTGVAARAGNLVDAVTRVLPLAALSVKTWSELPLGAAGESHARLTLDEEGKLVDLATDPKTPERLEHTLRNLRLLLRSGRFQTGKTEALVSRVVVRVFVERALGNDTLEGNGIDKMSAEYADRDHPGRAFVTYRSGLQLRFEVSLDERP